MLYVFHIICISLPEYALFCSHDECRCQKDVQSTQLSPPHCIHHITHLSLGFRPHHRRVNMNQQLINIWLCQFFVCARSQSSTFDSASRLAAWQVWQLCLRYGQFLHEWLSQSKRPKSRKYSALSKVECYLLGKAQIIRTKIISLSPYVRTLGFVQMLHWNAANLRFEIEGLVIRLLDIRFTAYCICI
jgi:hypothetical protein